MNKVKEPMAAINETVAKSMNEYMELGARVQDDMFKMAEKQIASYRQYSEFALNQQTEFFNEFQKNAKNTRELWLEGLKKWQTSVDGMMPKK
jgi:pyocin large subunit-like protein